MNLGIWNGGRGTNRKSEACFFWPDSRLHFLVLIPLCDSHHRQHQALEQVGALKVTVIVHKDVHQELTIVANCLQAANHNPLVSHIYWR